MTEISSTELVSRLTNYFYELEGHKPEIIETHTAWVFLSGDYAYKVKKPVDFPYLDFSTLPRRKEMCEREIRLNKRTAPQIYIDALAIIDGESGLSIGKSIPEHHKVIEYVVHMNRFSQDDLLSTIAEKSQLTEETIAGIAHNIVQLHHSAKQFPENTENLKPTGEGNDFMFSQQTDVLPRERTEALTKNTLAAHQKVADILKKRAENGMIRQCHGDMHLGNICLFNGAPTLFDCIEFNDDFAVIDVLYDLAFLIMDLRFRNMNDAAEQILQHYQQALPAESDNITDVLPLMVSIRAGIRSHVSVAMGQPQLALSYLEFAEQALNI